MKTLLFLKPTDRKEIEAIILSLNNSKSSGPFSILIRLLKTLAKGVSESYSLIVFYDRSRPNQPENCKGFGSS